MPAPEWGESSLKLDRWGDITSELSSSLVKSIVLPGGVLEWLSKPLGDRIRDRLKLSGAEKRPEPIEYRTVVPVGPLVLMGGAPAPDEAIVAMIHLAGGRSANLAVIPVATENHQGTAEEGVRLFTRFGMRKVQVLDLLTRERAESPEWAAKLASFDAVFLCGESASQGLAVLRQTACATALQEMIHAGKPVAGMGGAAAMMGELVLLSQDGQDLLAEGLGLAPGLLLDAEFTQASRFAHVARALQGENVPALMGVGIDAGSAVVIRDGEAKVLGESSATFLDPRENRTGSDSAISMPGLKVHVLIDGFVMNLRTRRPSGPAKEPPPRAVGDR